MRIVRFRRNGEARLGAMLADRSRILDLQDAVAALLTAEGDPFAKSEAAIRIPSDTASFLRGGARSNELARRAVQMADDGQMATYVYDRSGIYLEPPIIPPLIVCGGANFWGHLRELGRDPPENVEFFLKNSESVLGPEDDIPFRPWCSTKLDYEAELGIVIGRRARCVRVEEALDFVYGYTVVNDMAVRDRQLFRWDSGKTFQVKYGDGKVFDANSAIGPAIVSKDEISNPMALTLKTWVDGKIRQDSVTSEYIWGVKEVVSYYSSMITLEPGFVICPGTPGGCAVGTDPECGGKDEASNKGGDYLQPGQTVTVEVGEVGKIENRVRAFTSEEFNTFAQQRKHG